VKNPHLRKNKPRKASQISDLGQTPWFGTAGHWPNHFESTKR